MCLPGLSQDHQGPCAAEASRHPSQEPHQSFSAAGVLHILGTLRHSLRFTCPQRQPQDRNLVQVPCLEEDSRKLGARVTVKWTRRKPRTLRFMMSKSLRQERGDCGTRSRSGPPTGEEARARTRLLSSLSARGVLRGAWLRLFRPALHTDRAPSGSQADS